MHNFCGSYSWLAFAANLMLVPAEIPNQAGTEKISRAQIQYKEERAAQKIPWNEMHDVDDDDGHGNQEDFVMTTPYRLNSTLIKDTNIYI